MINSKNFAEKNIIFKFYFLKRNIFDAGILLGVAFGSDGIDFFGLRGSWLFDEFCCFTKTLVDAGELRREVEGLLRFARLLR